MIRQDGAEAELTYSIASPNLVIADHTGVPDAFRGRAPACAGRAAGRRCPAEGVQIVPLCPFVNAQRRKHELPPQRAPELDPTRIDDVLFGDANGAGEDNRNVARMAVLLAGLPTSVPGATINRLCGSSLDAAMQASRMIEGGDASVVVVGGVESMSRAPWILLKPERAFPRGHEQLYSSTLGWRMVNPEMPEQWTISLGESAEKLARIYEISRDAQDEFALAAISVPRPPGTQASTASGWCRCRTPSSRATRRCAATRR